MLGRLLESVCYKLQGDSQLTSYSSVVWKWKENMERASASASKGTSIFHSEFV